MQKAFILGNPRSGTSLLRIMLNTHSAIAAPPECGFLQWWFNKYGSWNIQNSTNIVDITYFVDDLLTSKKIESWNLDHNGLINFIANKKPRNYSELVLSIYEFWAVNNHKEPALIVDKNNYYIHHLKKLELIWPDAKYIHIIRDGRDIACSYLDLQKLDSFSPYKPNLSGDIKEIALEWTTNNKNICAFLKKFEPDKSIVIKYENLIRDTERVLRQITTFFKLPFSGKMMNYYKYNDEPESTIEWKKKTLRPPDPGNIGKYINQLTKNDQKIFKSIASEILQKYGYD